MDFEVFSLSEEEVLEVELNQTFHEHEISEAGRDIFGNSYGVSVGVSVRLSCFSVRPPLGLNLSDSFFMIPLLIEIFFGTLKTELVNHAVYRTRQDAMTDIFFFIEGFYNRVRRHSSLAFLSPADFEVAAAQPISLESCDFVSINPG